MWVGKRVKHGEAVQRGSLFPARMGFLWRGMVYRRMIRRLSLGLVATMLAVWGAIPAARAVDESQPARPGMSIPASDLAVVSASTVRAAQASSFTQIVPVAGSISESERIFTFSGENDSLTRSGDRFYTNGIRLSWFKLKDDPPAWARAIAEHVPMFDATKPIAVQYSLGQNMYTPSVINVFGPQPGDRPYAGYLYGSVGLTEGDAKEANDLEMSLGVVGPLSFAEQTQVAFHHLIHVHPPKGWDNQLHNEPALSLAWQRRWPTFWEMPLFGSKLTFMPHVGLTGGNVYDFAAAGGTLRWTSDADVVLDNPVRVRPGLPGTNYFSSHDHPVYTVFAGAEERAVARNIFLDGNTFGDSAHVDKRNFVSDLQAGVGLIWGRYELAYTTVYRSKEFFGQNRGELFGGLNFSVKY
jgi:hypothetical protein